MHELTDFSDHPVIGAGNEVRIAVRAPLRWSARLKAVHETRVKIVPRA